MFYVLCPIPIAIGRRCSSSGGGYGASESNSCTDLMWFITSAIVVSAFGLPAILFRANVVSLFDIYSLIFFFTKKI